MNRFACLLMPAGLLVLAGCGQSVPEAPTATTPLVLVSSATLQSPNAQSFVGVVTARDVINYSFGQTGVLATRDATLGEQVDADKILASLDVSTLQLNLTRSEAGVSSAQAQQSNAASALARAEGLAGQGLVTEAQLQTIREQVAGAGAALAQALAEAENARHQLDLATLRTTGSGIITAVNAEPGQVVQAGQAVISVARPDTKDLTIDVPAPLAASLSIGAEFDVALQLDVSVTSRGRLREISPQVDATARTRRALIELLDPPFPFWLGTTAVATLKDGAQEALLTVPKSAIFEADGAANVWIVKGDQPTLARQAVAWREGASADQAIITEGLTDGDTVVRIGVGELKDGQSVRVESKL